LDIVFQTTKFADECNDSKALIRKYGPDSAKRIRNRLADLSAAPNLETMRSLPGRCHELTGNLLGLLALDLKHPYRLIFEPANTPIPKKSDGGLDWSAVTAVRILRVEDYHG
jgi:proteic killer suppression protein